MKYLTVNDFFKNIFVPKFRSIDRMIVPREYFDD